MVYLTFKDAAFFVAYLVCCFGVLVVSYYLGWSDRESKIAVDVAAAVGGLMLLIWLFV